jgi:hypothetical protein
VTTHLVQFSTGVASAEIAWRLVSEHGSDDVVLLTADTRVEDADNWRFAHEVHGQLACQWVILADGRTPMEVGRDERCVPNDRMAVCSKFLKRKLLRRHIDQNYDPADTLIYEGYDWTEPERIAGAVPRWLPYTLKAPLADPPYASKPDLLAAFRGRGIEPPRLYAQGFPHANCGGACVRGGQAQWELLLRVHRGLYERWEADEEQLRGELGKDVSMMKETVRGQVRPLTLRKFRQRLDAQPGLFDCTDWGACGCKEA